MYNKKEEGKVQALTTFFLPAFYFNGNFLIILLKIQFNDGTTYKKKLLFNAIGFLLKPQSTKINENV